MTRKARQGLVGLVFVAEAFTSPCAAAPAEPGPATAPVVWRSLAHADALLQKARAAGVFPGAAIAVGRGAGILHLRGIGALSADPSDPPVSIDTLYDVASLTKVVATTATTMVLVDRGRLDLDTPLSSWFPELPEAIGDGARVRDLLTHSAGLPPWRPLSREAEDKRGILKRIFAIEAAYEPGSRSLYTDLGMILLGEVVERVTGQPLDAAAQQLVFAPLGMSDTRFGPGPELRRRVAPTIEDPWRGRVLRGEPQDDTAYRMGGVAGHAGLFSTAVDLGRFAEAMLRGGAHRGGRWVRTSTVDLFTRRVDLPASTRTLGWETPAGDRWAGRWSPRAYGHTGITGTSLWIDPARDVYLVLLANPAPSRTAEFDAVRRDVAEAVIAAIDSGAAAPPAPSPR